MHAQSLASKLSELPPERVAEVEDFIDFLRSRQPQRKKPRVPFDLPVDHVGQWPEDLSLRRENMYGDDGR